MTDKPNIIFIFTDQHRLSAMGAYGDTPCQTPNLDRLAQQGVRFENTYTVFPVCSPARGTIMTGVYPHTHGVTANIHEIYAQGGTLDDVWEEPFFSAIRAWQRRYGYGQPSLSAEANWVRPCPFRDHHGIFRQWVAQYHPEPEDEAAAAALADEAFYRQMIARAEQNAPISQAIWEQEYL